MAEQKVSFLASGKKAIIQGKQYNGNQTSPFASVANNRRKKGK